MNNLDLEHLNLGGGRGSITNKPTQYATNIDDDTTAVVMDSTYINKITLSDLNASAKTVTLPTFTNVGDYVQIITADDLNAGGVMTINPATGQGFAATSHVLYLNTTPNFDNNEDAESTITLTGADTNFACAAGSSFVFTYLGANTVLIEGDCRAVGTGNDLVAWG